jgi:chromosome segregation ATPase
MDDNTKDLDQQESSSDQQPAGTQATENWEERFKGLQRKFNALMDAKGDLDSQLVEQRSKKEELEKQLATLSNEKESLTNENKKKIDELTSQLNEKEQTLSELSQMQLKVKVANDLGHPELLQLIDTIPNSDSPEQIEQSMKTILGFTKAQIERREQEITEGLMPGETSSDGAPLPSSEEGWQDMIDKLPLGSSERSEAMDHYFEWVMGKE